MRTLTNDELLKLEPEDMSELQLQKYAQEVRRRLEVLQVRAEHLIKFVEEQQEKCDSAFSMVCSGLSDIEAGR